MPGAQPLIRCGAQTELLLPRSASFTRLQLPHSQRLPEKQALAGGTAAISEAEARALGATEAGFVAALSAGETRNRRRVHGVPLLCRVRWQCGLEHCRPGTAECWERCRIACGGAASVTRASGASFSGGSPPPWGLSMDPARLPAVLEGNGPSHFIKAGTVAPAPFVKTGTSNVICRCGVLQFYWRLHTVPQTQC